MKKFWYTLVKGKSLIRVKKGKVKAKKLKDKNKKHKSKAHHEEEELENQKNKNPFVVGSSLTLRIVNLLLSDLVESKEYKAMILAWELACEYNDVNNKYSILKTFWKQAKDSIQLNFEKLGLESTEALDQELLNTLIVRDIDLYRSNKWVNEISK